MNSSAARYKSKLKQKLQCSRRMKAELLTDFTHSLDGFLDEKPDATFADLSNAFGPPEEMANILMEQVSEQETCTYKLHQTLRHIVAVVLAIVLFLFTVYVLFWKQKPIISYTEIITSTEFVVTETLIEGE